MVKMRSYLWLVARSKKGEISWQKWMISPKEALDKQGSVDSKHRIVGRACSQCNWWSDVEDFVWLMRHLSAAAPVVCTPQSCGGFDGPPDLWL
ncbi:hypothetical protein Ancab_005539 [Ancistrocladus abbreviatus]